jgi:adenylate kinase family enzyme
MNPQTFIFIGRSGCGKGTQAKLLIDYLKGHDQAHSVFYLESGAVFRKLIAENTHTAKLAKRIYEAGGLQPEFLAVWVWANLLIDTMTGEEHLVIDGTPRKPREAHVLDSAFKFYKREKPTVVHLDVSREWSVSKLTDRNRPDDNPGDIEARLNWFESEVMPAINFFRGNSYYRVLDINGEQPIEKVHADVVASIEWPK